jgi:hypothetical protein
MTLTATVSAAGPGSGTPTGTVTFYDGKKALGTATLEGGVATFPTKKLKLGAHAISVVYHGDADFNGDTSAVLREIIRKPPRRKKSRAKDRLPVGTLHQFGNGSALGSKTLIPSMFVRDLALEDVVDGPWARESR